MQDPKDETKFCIVERYQQESSQQYHLNNPVRLTLARCKSIRLTQADDIVLEGKLFYLRSALFFVRSTFYPLRSL